MTPKEKGISLTFSQIYDLWSEWHYPNIAPNTIKGYENAYRKCSTIYKCNFIDISQDTLQGVIDDVNGINMKYTLHSMFKCIWDFAVRKEFITPEKNRTRYLDIPKREKSTMHRRLTDEELCILWDNRDDETVAIYLILIYTGCRPMELFGITKNQVHKDCFEIYGGKTENAKRLVPIHEEIKPLFKHMRYDIVSQGDYINWTNNKFTPAMKRLGIKCRPYDARHTFATLWAENKLDEQIRCKIQGHSLQGIGQKVYTHYSAEILGEELNKLPIVKTHK